ncbi:hypothetical protein HDU76_003401 [Blyttiomyces sp. JEL0837]|nr:hypothetical protein HDU76_003401 [Blyttiomyces sp. JEL0837]
MAYEQYKAIIMPTKDKETPGRRLLAGSLADLLRTRLAFEVKSHNTVSLSSTAALIYNEPNAILKNAGILNFYRGFVPTVYGMIPYAGVSFLCYETFKSWATQNPLWTEPFDVDGDSKLSEKDRNRKLAKGPQLNWWAQFFVGGVSGAIAQTVSYPLEVIRRRMQVAGRRPDVLNATTGGGSSSVGVSNVPVRFPTTWETAKTIFATKGVRGFFVGLSIGYLKITPMHAVSFFVYEWMKTALDID